MVTDAARSDIWLPNVTKDQFVKWEIYCLRFRDDFRETLRDTECYFSLSNKKTRSPPDLYGPAPHTFEDRRVPFPKTDLREFIS